MLVAATLRSAEPGTDPALLAEIVQDPATHPLRPGPLSADAVAALVRERLGDDADPGFCAACHQATGGNPLLLRQLLRALEAEGVQPVADRVDVVRAVGPRAVSSTVLLRLSRLSEDARAVARATAVLGESAELPRVAALAGRDERAVAAASGELIRAEIIRPEPPLGFVHPLVRDAVYHELPPAERELEHERAAEMLREAGADIEQVAAQLLLAPRRGAAWAAELLQRAGSDAVRRGAAESAVAYLRRALEEPPAPEQRTAGAARPRRRRGADERPGGDASTCARPTRRWPTRGRAPSSRTGSAARCSSPAIPSAPRSSRPPTPRRSARRTPTSRAAWRRSG